MNCDSTSYSSLKHISQTILQQIVEINKHVADANENKEMTEEDKNKLIHFANYHLLVLSIILHDCLNVTRKEFPDAEGIVKWSEVMYQNGLDKGIFTPCRCIECKSPEVEAELVS